MKLLTYVKNAYFILMPRQYIKSAWGQTDLRRIRSLTLSRDGKCKKCGSSRKLENHHIKPKSKRPKLAFRLYNCIILCSDCHRLGDKAIHKQHGYNVISYKEFNEWLED